MYCAFCCTPDDTKVTFGTVVLDDLNMSKVVIDYSRRDV